MKKGTLFLIALSLLASTTLFAQAPTPMVTIKGGKYVPLYGVKTDDKKAKPVEVKTFQMDIYPVTNAQYLQFVKAQPQWQRSHIKGIFAQKSYLSQWKGDTNFGDLTPDAPVTNISWFAAKNYCQCQGKRLPTTDEWEYVAQADAQSIDARKKKTYQDDIARWLQTPKTYLHKVGSTPKNYWGVYDMHGLVWEWVSDFNSVLLSGDSRQDKQGDDTLFCGGSALNASDLTNYGAFMRYALRGSLKANYTTINMGFRCAK